MARINGSTYFSETPIYVAQNETKSVYQNIYLVTFVCYTNKFNL
jgi:hypothetical protein